MSTNTLLKTVKNRFPELKKLPRAQLRLVEEALVYASEVNSKDGFLTPKEHEDLMKELTKGRDYDSPAGRLWAYRHREDLTQAQLAKKSGISQTNLSAMENGRRPIGLNVAKKLGAILNCDYKKFL